MAEKAENTKFGKKCRETWSASDVFRELQSESECNLRPLAASIHGVSLHDDEGSVEAQDAQHGQMPGHGEAQTHICWLTERLCLVPQDILLCLVEVCPWYIARLWPTMPQYTRGGTDYIYIYILDHEQAPDDPTH